MLEIRQVHLEVVLVELHRHRLCQSTGRHHRGSMIKSITEAAPQLEAMVGRLGIEDHVEAVVAVVDHIKLEGLRELEVLLVDRAVALLEVLIDDGPVELALVLKVLEQRLVLRIDDHHHRLEPGRPSREVLATLQLLEADRIADRPLLRYHVKFAPA